MKVLILGAGYGTRMEKDLKEHDSDEYRSLIGVPKPLLPIGKYALITHWMKLLKDVENVTDIYVVTNASNHDLFVKWKEAWPSVQLLSEGSSCNEDRSGAVACIDLIIKAFNIEDDLMIIAGDTLFYEDFSVQDLLTEYSRIHTLEHSSCLLLHLNCPEEDVHKRGIIETNVDGRVVAFLEKPNPRETTSRKQCPCFYILSKASLSLVHQFLEEHKDKPLQARDATGNFVKYLYPRIPVYSHEVSGRFDVGGLQSYITCHQYFLEKS